MPRVSVIIPTYNGAAFIAETLRSVLAQTFRNYEVLVVDDGSTDDTAAVVRSFGHEVRYFYKENGGPGAARNFGLRHARGEYIALLDHDDLWLPQRLELGVEVLDQQPDVAMVYADAYVYDQAGEEVSCRSFEASRPHQGRIFAELFKENFIPNLTVLVRKSCLLEFGGFDESGRMLITDDYHMWLLLAARYPVARIDRPVGTFRVHEGNLSGDLELVHWNVVATLEDICRRYPGILDAHGGLKARRFAELSYKLGKLHFLNQRFAESQEELKKALREYPFQWKSMVLLVLNGLRGIMRFGLGDVLAARIVLWPFRRSLKAAIHR